VKEDPKRKGLLVAGTERGVYASLDDGESWQSLQLNLPVTSMRDFEIYGDDLIVATHGRGFWVIDDISPLRQASDELLAADAHLFKPADSINVLPSDDNGTPLQMDEPQAPNPPIGAAIDYYLRSPASGPVMIEILDASGVRLHLFSSDPGSSAPAHRRRRTANGGIPNVSPLWQAAPDPLPGAAGMHRVVWTPLSVEQSAQGGPEGRVAPTPLSGTFTAKLTANGRIYTQTFVVKPDPRSK
jgi:hypothetical protein